jgi:hypothetical protein
MDAHPLPQVRCRLCSRPVNLHSDLSADKQGHSLRSPTSNGSRPLSSPFPLQRPI